MRQASDGSGTPVRPSGIGTHTVSQETGRVVDASGTSATVSFARSRLATAIVCGICTVVISDYCVVTVFCGSDSHLFNLVNMRDRVQHW
jgi:hypothetical protein